MKEYSRALEAFESALSKDKENKDAQDGVQRTFAAMHSRNQVTFALELTTK